MNMANLNRDFESKIRERTSRVKYTIPLVLSK